MTSTTNPAAALLELCDRTEANHHVGGNLYGHDVCGYCRQEWPCDAHQAAAALRLMTTDLEMMRDSGNPPDANYSNWAEQALTAAVRHIEGGGE